MNSDRDVVASFSKCLIDNGGGSFSLRTNGTLANLTDVVLTSPQDGDVLKYSNVSHFTSTLSPLRWNSVDYNQGVYGVATSPSTVYFFGGNVFGITADGDTFDQAGSTADLNVGLIQAGAVTPATFILPYGYLTGQGQAETAAGLQAYLRVAAGDPTMTVDNFKAHAFTYHAGANYTWNGFTGFEQAGAVTVVSGKTSPPAITFVPGLNKFVNASGYTKHHFAGGLFSTRGDTPQTIATATPTNMVAGTTIPFADSRFTVGPDVTVSGINMVGGHGVVTVIDDTNAIVSSAIIEVQTPTGGGGSLQTEFVGLGGSVAFPVDADSTQNSYSWRVKVTQTSGGNKNLFYRVDLYWQE